MPGILYQNPMRGLLSEPDPQPTGLLGALTSNPLMARQVAAQRAANPRPDVTDLFGYGPSWQTYLQNLNNNLQAQLPQPNDSGTAMAQKGLGMVGLFGVTAPKGPWLHGSAAEFDRFKIKDDRLPAVFVSAKNPDRKSYAEHIAERRGYLYEAELANAKRFDPMSDKEAAEIYKKLFPEREVTQWVDYGDIYIGSPLVEAMKKHGYDTVRVWEPSVGDFSEAVLNPDLLQITKRTKTK